MPSVRPLRLKAPGAPARIFDEILTLASGLELMGPGARADADETPSGPEERRALRATGFATLPRLCRRATCSALATMIERLGDAGLPGVFALATDAALALGERVCREVSVSLGRPYVLVEDAWAWRIPPGSHGWPPHRGLTSLLDRDAPELVNTWVALSDVPIHRSCMHFVPLDVDPAYPADLARVDASSQDVHAAPLAAGEALAWNANVLHWGGPCSIDAGPRMSCAFSLVRADSLESMQLAPLSTGLNPLERIDFLASQIAIYGADQADVTPEILEWAQATRALAALVRKER